MRKLPLILTLGILATSLLAGCAQVYTNPTKIIKVSIGEEFIIEVDSNPTTGYSWQAQFDDSLIGLVNTEFKSKSQAIGAGGVERFTFKALAKDGAEITLVYKRAWEEGYEDIKTFRVTIE